MPGQELNLFAEPDVSRHDKRLRQVASMYQMSTVIGMEENVDRVTARFCERMKTFAQSRQQFDMTIWVYYYAFDVIADLAVSARSASEVGEADVSLLVWEGLRAP